MQCALTSLDAPELHSSSQVRDLDQLHCTKLTVRRRHLYNFRQWNWPADVTRMKRIGHGLHSVFCCDLGKSNLHQTTSVDQFRCPKLIPIMPILNWKIERILTWSECASTRYTLYNQNRLESNKKKTVQEKPGVQVTIQHPQRGCLWEVPWNDKLHPTWTIATECRRMTQSLSYTNSWHSIFAIHYSLSSLVRGIVFFCFVLFFTFCHPMYQYNNYALLKVSER